VASGSTTRPFRRLPLLVGLGLSLAGRAAAESPGIGPHALPSIERVGVAGGETPRFVLATTIGYGWTESLGPVPGSHHRLSGTLAATATPTSWLNVGAAFDERYDVHPRDALGRDDSAVGDPRLLVRASRRFTENLGLGTELVGWFPGDTAPSIKPGAATLDLRLLASWWHPSSGTVVAALAGLRLDQSGESVRHPEWLRAGDRISLGVSDSHAVLVGLGLSQQFGPFEALGELCGDWLVGSRAPRWSDSPWRVTLGLRRRATRALSFELRGDALLSGRPPVGPNDPLVPIEPRFALGAGVRVEFWGKPATSPPPPVAEPKTGVQPVGTSAQPVPVIATLNGKITDTTGQGVEHAHVTLTLGGQKLEADTAADGSFTFNEVPPGAAELRVDALGYVTVRRQITPREGATVAVALEPALPAGQLRGLIRSFAGEPLSARVEVEPGGISAQTDREGRFELDLAPGSYRVMIEADGYRPQKRTVRIENRGVTVINAELEGKR
jgi:hypothetical protein